MKKLNEKKQRIFNEINNLISNSISTTIINYSNITSLELKYLRQTFFKKNITAKVLKNNLVKKALINTENDKLIPYLSGQILIIFSNNDVSDPIKIIKNFSLKNNNFKIKATCIYGKVFTNDGIQKIINLKSKEDEIYNIIQQLKMPIVKLILILKTLTTLKKGDQNDN